jgi:hypothetical protein
MNTFASLESLETRSLCSATPLTGQLLDTVSVPAIHMTAQPLKRTVTGVAPGPVSPAARLGTYTGMVFVKGTNIAAPFTLTLTSLKKGKLSGTVTSPLFTGSRSFTTAGKMDAAGKFSTTFNKNGISGGIEGQMGKKGRVAGTFTVTLGLQKVTGTYSATKN